MQVTDLKNDVDFLCGSTSASYPDAAKIRNINIAYNDVARLIWDSAGGWQYDDTNATTLPVAYASLTHGQQDYELPSTAQRIHRVEVRDKDGNWWKLKAIDASDISVATQEFPYQDAGLPVYYDLLGRSLVLYPTPSTAYAASTSALAVHMDRDITEFATTASTSTPGFAKGFHRILSLAAAIDFTQDDKQKQYLIAERSKLQNDLVRFYRGRARESQQTIKPYGKKRWRQYL